MEPTSNAEVNIQTDVGHSRKEIIFESAPLISVLLVVFAFCALSVNRFFPVTEGWFQDYADYMRAGMVPYRDYYLFVPPFFPALMTAISVLSSNTFLVFRLYGITERLVLVTLTFFLLRRVLKPQTAVIALLTGSIVYMSNVQDLFYGYYQTSLLLSLIMLVFALSAYEKLGQKNWLSRLALVGISGGITTMCKHTTGVILFFILQLVLMILVRNRTEKPAMKAFFALWLGFTLTIAVCLIPLAATGALIPMAEQLFAGGSSKGSLFTILMGALTKLFTKRALAAVGWFSALFVVTALERRVAAMPKLSQKTVFVVGLIGSAVLTRMTMTVFVSMNLMMQCYLLPALILVCLTGLMIASQWLLLSQKTNLTGTTPNQKERATAAIKYVLFSACFVTVLFVIAREDYYLLINWSAARELRRHIHFAVFLIELAVAACYFFDALFRKKTSHATQLLLLATACGIMYIHGMSNELEDHAMLLSVSLMTGYLLESSVLHKTFRHVLICSTCLAMIVCIFIQRYQMPYYWWGVNTLESAYSADYTYDDPHLAGLRGSEHSAKALNEIYHVVTDTMKEGDTMFSFPHIAYFNVMSGLKNNLFAKTHFFDVCCDQVAIRDADTLLADPPNYIVWMELSDDAWALHEKLFRDGRPCGQREIRQSYETLIQSQKYELLWSGRISLSDPLYVWHIIPPEHK